MRAALCLLLLSLSAEAAVPFIDAVSRPSAAVGWGPLAVTVSGANFDYTCTIHFGGLILHPDSVSPSRLGFTIPYTALTTPRTLSLTIANASGVSNAVPFPVSTQSTSFSANRNGYPMSEPVVVATADFNHDGKPDVAVGSWCSTKVSSCRPGTVNIMLGDGAGNFTQSYSTPAGDQPNALGIGDFNHDGNMDVAAVSSDKTLTILLGDGTGHFRTTFVNLSQSNSGSLETIAVGDFNSDGNLDLVIAGEITGPLLFLGDGLGNFTAQPTRLTSDGANSIVAADFNGDGHLDLAVAYFYSTSLTVLFGDGAGNFTSSTVPLDYSARAVAAGDFNGDGIPDLAVAVLYGGVYIFSNDGTGRFQRTSAPISVQQPVSIAVADLNGDRKLDLAVASQSGGLTLLTGDGAGGFTAAAPLNAGATPVSVAIDDFNADGLPDLAVASANDGTFSILNQTPSAPLRTLYTVKDVCPFLNCTLSVLSDTGVMAGPDIAIYPDTGYINFFQRTGQHFYPFSINRAGVIAGGTDTFGIDYRALAWVPSESAFLNLNPAFGWSQGRAEFVNDRNQIVGEPLQGVVNGIIPGFALSRVAAVTDNGVVVGNDVLGRGVLYSPGLGVTFIANSLSHGAFNTAGQILYTAPVIGGFASVGSGLTTLPAPPALFTVTGFNDVGQFLGWVQLGSASTAGLYTPSGGLVPLDTLLPPGTGWTLTYGLAINNNGQILARGTLGGKTSVALLTPYLEGTAPASPGIALRPPERRASCGALTFNTRDLCSAAATRLR